MSPPPAAASDAASTSAPPPRSRRGPRAKSPTTTGDAAGHQLRGRALTLANGLCGRAPPPPTHLQGHAAPSPIIILVAELRPRPTDSRAEEIPRPSTAADPPAVCIHTGRFSRPTLSVAERTNRPPLRAWRSTAPTKPLGPTDPWPRGPFGQPGTIFH